MSRYAKLSSWLIGAWFVVSIVASGLHLYQNDPKQPPLPLGIAALAPIIVFLVWFALSASFREFTMSLSPRVLTLVQTLRIEGFAFLVLASYSILPRTFALSAGWGDIAIGATASLAAWKLATPNRRGSFIVWQILGIADLVNAVLMGTLAGVINPHGISTGAMTVLPLSLIPTFAVPLFLILHVICIAQALRWRKEPVQPVAQERWSEAV
ncbi:MAG TPA: hypothetical protein VGT04_04780 [Acidobacteriaceae bacterium]|nr:hypothetical protein [Acidobacteriaceae bacterium]